MLYTCTFSLLIYVGETCQLCGVPPAGSGEGRVAWSCPTCVGG